MAPNGNGRIRILAACLTAIPVVALTAACGVDTSSRTGGSVGSGPVVVGAADTIESELVARLYAGALGANGTATELVLGLGDQADRLAALDGNRVSLVPEHTGRLLHRFDSAAEVTEEEDVYDALSRSLPEGLSVSEYAPADDRSALVLTEEQADVLGASSVADLAPRCSRLTLYASEDFAADAGALDRLQSLYGCTFAEVVPAGSPAAGTRELAAGASPVHGTTAADSVVAQDELVVLTDEEGAFTAQNVVPLFRSGVLTADDIRSLSVILQLSTADLTAMAARVRDGELSSADAAAAWLEEHV